MILPLLAAAAVAAAPAPPVDPGLPDYHPAVQVSGQLEGVAGMDTVEAIMAAWNDAFRRFHPGAQITMTQKDVAPEERIALGAGTDEVFSPDDLPFENRYGYDPFRIRFARGAFRLKSHVSAIGVFVNASNPISELSLAQLDAIYSAERRRGYPADIATWGQLGLGGPWADRPIHIYGFYWRDDVTAYFRRLALLDAPFKRTYSTAGDNLARRTPVVAHDIMAALAADPGGIAFANFSYEAGPVKALALSDDHGVVGRPELEDVVAGRYPLERDLYLYVNRRPGQPLPPLVKEFLAFVLSREGQELVERDHYFPLSAAAAAEERAKLE